MLLYRFVSDAHNCTEIAYTMRRLYDSKLIINLMGPVEHNYFSKLPITYYINSF